MRTRQSLKPGFTLIELAVVVFIAGLIIAIAVPRMSHTIQEHYARNARDAFTWTANRARSRAIQTGSTVLLVLNPSNERAWVYKRNPTVTSDTIVSLNFSTQFQSQVSTASNNVLTICYSPRGYAYDCTGGGTNTVEVTFTHGVYTSKARVKPLGQVERL
ncbi:MAG TPA: GspH/FimT family pseudopilin [Longimicrobiales bacterium]